MACLIVSASAAFGMVIAPNATAQKHVHFIF
jgi:hypothetical protein